MEILDRMIALEKEYRDVYDNTGFCGIARDGIQVRLDYLLNEVPGGIVETKPRKDGYEEVYKVYKGATFMALRKASGESA